MPNHAYHATAAPGVVQRARNTHTGRKLERGGYLTPETVTMWIVYALTLIGNAVIEGGQLGGNTSATVAYGVFTWFTPAGYVFSIWSVIYIAMIVWLVAYTRQAPARPKRFTPTSVLFIASCVLNVLWLALWHFELVGISFIVILAEWATLAALYMNVRRTATSGAGWIPVSLYTAWVTVATLANMAILITRVLDGGVPFLNGLSVIALTAGVLVLGYIMKKTYQDNFFQIVFLWALIGVGVNVAPASGFVSGLVFVLCIVGAVFTWAPIGKLRQAVGR
ncbi:TspO/MBR family protein [Gordonibacter sp.]|uniref:TspO/MBR family protein n=1 Tax=Gordonibacter sp. TaxID=1968902 RepID=UPI001F9E7375|nr:TspO/MBR family protein [Gordonibacter sp.]HIW77228.1 tryptophan-rich sensory protein [Candidatus Gordonibacter avicola]